MTPEQLILLGGGVAAAGLVSEAVKRWRGHPAIKPSPKGGVNFAGEFFPWERVCSHIGVIGRTGSGKTFSSNELLGELMRAGCPMLLTTVKPDDCQRICDIAKKRGQLGRVVRIAPGAYQTNLLEQLLKLNPASTAAAEALTRIGEVGKRGTGQSEDKFWVTQAQSAMASAITLLRATKTPVSIPAVYRIILSTPSSLAALKSPEWDPKVDCERGLCAQLVVKGIRMGLEDSDPDFTHACEYEVKEIGGGGDKQRGGVIAESNNTLRPFIGTPWAEALSGKTTIAPEIIDRERLIGVIDTPEMVGLQPARMHTFAHTMLAQMYAMQRPYVPGTPPMVLWRDEVARILVGDWDASVMLVARSQGLACIDLWQDMRSLKMALGGGKSTDEAWAFMNNHATRFCFGLDCAETAKWASERIGQERQMMFSGGSGGQHKQGNASMLDDVLGVSGDVHWQEAWNPIMRPEEFSKLPVGMAVMLGNGSYRVIDFRK